MTTPEYKRLTVQLADVLAITKRVVQEFAENAETAECEASQAFWRHMQLGADAVLGRLSVLAVDVDAAIEHFTGKGAGARVG